MKSCRGHAAGYQVGAIAGKQGEDSSDHPGREELRGKSRSDVKSLPRSKRMEKKRKFRDVSTPRKDTLGGLDLRDWALKSAITIGDQ